MNPPNKLQPLILIALLAVAPAAQTVAAGKPQATSAKEQQGSVRISLLGMQSRVPGSWRAQPPATSSRLAQYSIPGKGAGQEAEFIVYFFGAGQGGSANENIIRWRGQFFGPNGAPVTPRVERFKVNGMAVTTVDLRGAYARGIGIGPVGVPKADQTLLAAVVESPKGNLIVQLHGPRTTVSAQYSAFMAFLKGLQPAPG